VKTFESTCDKRTIPYPKTESEFEIQAFIYAELRALGVDVRGELVTVFFDGINGKQKHRTMCRFDLVIFENKIPIRIVEVKHGRKTFVSERARQCERYRKYGVPVTFVFGMEQAIRFVSDFTDTILPY